LRTRVAGRSWRAARDLRALPEALALSRRTVAVIRQNLLWASIYNLVLIPIAAGAFGWAGITMPPAVQMYGVRWEFWN
jgi:cation transport ATPase